MPNPKILVLYSELADYTLACLGALKASGARVALIHWPVNPEAPFQFDLSFLDRHHDRKVLTNDMLIAIAREFQPDLVLCSGWMDKGYLAVCRAMAGQSIRVLTLDNHWTGNLRQRIAVLVSPFTLKRAFSHAFVPGQKQKQYALHLGFSEENIQTGFYCADTVRFNRYYEARSLNEQTPLPKRFLYMGRYVRHKGVTDLWDAFQKARQHFPDWELWCCGTGTLYDQRVEGQGIRHFGFVQPHELLPILQETAIYILPSHFEPWGVSVHEMAAAGFPMILSDRVGACEDFLSPGNNGLIFKAGNVEALCEAMCTLAADSDSGRYAKSIFSHRLAQENTPDIWAKRVLAFLDNSQ